MCWLLEIASGNSYGIFLLTFPFPFLTQHLPLHLPSQYWMLSLLILQQHFKGNILRTCVEVETPFSHAPTLNSSSSLFSEFPENVAGTYVKIMLVNLTALLLTACLTLGRRSSSHNSAVHQVELMDCCQSEFFPSCHSFSISSPPPQQVGHQKNLHFSDRYSGKCP